jgi:DNA-binding transcriptional regulator YdaS (Cro superfamily)
LLQLQQIVGNLLHMMNAVERAIREAGGTKAVACALDMSEWGVRKWVHNGVPPERVIWLSERGGWVVTPHELAPSIYPYPNDGLPPVDHASGSCARVPHQI